MPLSSPPSSCHATSYIVGGPFDGCGCPHRTRRLELPSFSEFPTIGGAKFIGLASRVRTVHGSDRVVPAPLATSIVYSYDVKGRRSAVSTIAFVFTSTEGKAFQGDLPRTRSCFETTPSSVPASCASRRWRVYPRSTPLATFGGDHCTFIPETDRFLFPLPTVISPAVHLGTARPVAFDSSVVAITCGPTAHPTAVHSSTYSE